MRLVRKFSSLLVVAAVLSASTWCLGCANDDADTPAPTTEAGSAVGATGTALPQ